MKIIKLQIILLAIIATVSGAKAQDIHFSQFYASPLTLNPAMTGVMTCDARFSAIYRNQWASVLGNKAFNTGSAGFEMKFPVGKDDYWAAGASFWFDRAGTSGFTSVNGALSASYLKKIGGRRSNDHYLVAGAQIGFMTRSIKIDQLRWGAQWDGEAFNGSLPSLEDITNTSLTVADINAGLLWFSSLDKKNQSNFYIGFAFHHLTKANIAFIKQGTEPLYIKYTIHGGLEARLAKRLAIVPNFALHFQGKSMQTNFGTGVKFDFSKRNKSSQAFTIGVHTRLVNDYQKAIAADALIASLRLRFGSDQIGFAYDINISTLSAASRSNGAFELSYVHTFCGMRGRKLGCPSF